MSDSPNERIALAAHTLRPVRPEKYIITGAGGGLGYELGKAILSSKARADVTLTYRGKALPEKLQELQGKYPNQVSCSQLDLNDSDSIAKFTEDYGQKHGPVDVLLSCAAVFKPRDPKENTLRNLKNHPELLTEALSSNCEGHMSLVSHLMKDEPLRLRQRQVQRTGNTIPQKFILIGSAGSRFSGDNPKLARMGLTYATSKAGLHMGVYKAAEEEKGNQQFIISCVDPGWMDTKMGGSGAPSGSTKEAAVKISGLIETITKEDSGTLMDSDGNKLNY
ncbi:SDR family NAD(P)-dependent oxidoreductase [Endozoicomonas atrinae]|uniref:SDR family NAD(P)-dependent oxidoreductase n=1 Tax=Endozoicomonas atrinae TaxID=1333660 RepID=UPI0008264D90|nr:SDR family NAD(P)-dependent oxidoreductase [Endozoicomonas atrinae]